MMKSQSFLKSSQNFEVFGLRNFWGRGPQISDPILKIWVTSEHVAKFGGDRLSDLRDYAAKN